MGKARRLWSSARCALTGDHDWRRIRDGKRRYRPNWFRQPDGRLDAKLSGDYTCSRCGKTQFLSIPIKEVVDEEDPAQEG